MGISHPFAAQVDRFASAWAYLQARHADVWGRDRVDAFVEALYDGAGAAGLTAARLVALRGNHTIAKKPSGPRATGSTPCSRKRAAPRP